MEGRMSAKLHIEMGPGSFDFWVGVKRQDLMEFKTSYAHLKVKVVSLHVLNSSEELWEIEIASLHERATLFWEAKSFQGIYSPRTRNGHLLIEGIEEEDLRGALFESRFRIFPSSAHSKITAIQVLRRLRSDDPPWEYDREIWSHVRDVERRDLTLADVGTTEEELEQLRICCSKHNIAHLLASLRAGENPKRLDWNLKALCEEMSKFVFAPEEVGTTTEELEVFARKYPYKKP